MIALLRRLLGRHRAAEAPAAPAPVVTYTRVEPTYADEREARYQTWGITR